MVTTRPGWRRSSSSRANSRACKLDFLPAASDFAREQIHREIAGRKFRRLGGVRGAANERLHAGQQFGKCKRLCQIIVAARLQAFHAVIHAGLRAEDEHGREDFVLAQLAEQRKAVELRQHDVEHRRVVSDRAGQRETLFTVGRMIHGEAILLQPVDDERGDLAVIFNYQHAHNSSETSVSKACVQRNL